MSTLQRWAMVALGTTIILSACKARSDALTTDASAAMDSIADAAAPKATSAVDLIPPDPPPPLAAKASEVAESDKELLADPKYAAIWEPPARPDLEKVLSAISFGLETMGQDGKYSLLTVDANALDAKKLATLVRGPLADVGRIGDLPADFRHRLEAYTAAVKDDPHHGVWRAPTRDGANDGMDWAALASWLYRKDAAYARELLAARKVMPNRGWGAAAAKKPYLRYLQREKTAIQRVALLSNMHLTEEEEARLDEITASPLGDEPAESISLAELLKEYSSNEVRADDRFKGHVVEFGGVAGAIERGAIGGITLDISTGRDYEHPIAHCFFDAAQTMKVKALNRGDRVRVRGKVDGLMINVLVSHCEVVN